MKTIILTLVSIGLIGISCAIQKKTLYYWGDYSKTLYALKKTPNDEHLTRHKKALQEIIGKSAEKKLKVPPGVYAEYGFILAREGDSKGAEKYFKLEAETYPEATPFMEKLVANLDNSKKVEGSHEK